jgi:hypothetical protein
MAKIKLTGTAMYARLREDNKDTGNASTPDNIRAKLQEVGGVYLMNLYFDDSVKRKDLIAAGVPHKGMLGQLIKEDNEGNLFYKCKRNHQRVSKDGKTFVFGPPKVTYQGEDFTDNIGNGSIVEVTLDRWDGNSVTLVSMEEVNIIDLIPYEAPEREEVEVTSVGGKGSYYKPPADTPETNSAVKPALEVADDEVPF